MRKIEPIIPCYGTVNLNNTHLSRYPQSDGDEQSDSSENDDADANETLSGKITISHFRIKSIKFVYLCKISNSNK